VLLIAALGLTAQGCFVWGHSGPTPVSMGQKYQSGEPQYDEFFDHLHKLQLVMVGAPRDEKSMRTELAEGIGLDSDSSVHLIAKRTKKLSEDLAAHGTELRVEFVGLDDDSHDADAIVTIVKNSGNPEDVKIVKAIEEAAKRAVKLVVKMRESKRAAQRLNADLAPLETELDLRFKLLGPARTSDARRNLYDAKTLLPLIVERSDTVARDARDLIGALEDAAIRPKEDSYQAPSDVADKAPPTPAAKPEKPIPSAQKSKPGAAAEKPAAPAAKPTAAPAKRQPRTTELADFSP
jgi:hypothetical protein